MVSLLVSLLVEMGYDQEEYGGIIPHVHVCSWFVSIPCLFVSQSLKLVAVQGRMELRNKAASETWSKHSFLITNVPSTTGPMMLGVLQAFWTILQIMADATLDGHVCIYMGVSENSGFYPQIIHLNRVFHCKPSILGYHYFRKHPYILYIYCTFMLMNLIYLSFMRFKNAEYIIQYL